LCVEEIANSLGVRGRQRLRVEMGSSERAVAEFGPRGNLEGLEALFRCPDRDVVQRESRQAGRQEPELHVATSVQAPVRADPSTVCVIRTATEGSATEGGAGCPGATVSRAAAVLDGMRPDYIDRRPSRIASLPGPGAEPRNRLAASR